MIKTISKNEIPDRNQKYIEVIRDIEEFLNSEAEAEKLDYLADLVGLPRLDFPRKEGGETCECS